MLADIDLAGFLPAFFVAAPRGARRLRYLQWNFFKGVRRLLAGGRLRQLGGAVLPDVGRYFLFGASRAKWGKILKKTVDKGWGVVCYRRLIVRFSRCSRSDA